MSPISSAHRFLFVAATLIAFGGSPAHASEKDQQIALSTQIYESGGSAGLTYNHALGGELSGSGPRLRLNARYGTSETRSGVRNERTSADLMLGYQFARKNWRVKLHAGASYVDRKLIAAGRKDGLGFKATLDLQTARSRNYYLDIGSSYATQDNSYRVAVQTGVRVGKVFIGPEAAITGSDYYKAKRVGAVLSGVKLNKLRLSFRAGQSFGDEEGSGRDSLYGGMGASFQF